MTEQTTAPPAPPPADVVQGDEKVRMTHPDVDGTSVVSIEQFEQVYEPRGWEIVPETTTAAADVSDADREAIITVRHAETGQTKQVQRGELLDRMQTRGWSEVDGTATTAAETGTAPTSTPAPTTTGGATPTTSPVEAPTPPATAAETGTAPTSTPRPTRPTP